MVRRVNGFFRSGACWSLCNANHIHQCARPNVGYGPTLGTVQTLKSRDLIWLKTLCRTSGQFGGVVG